MAKIQRLKKDGNADAEFILLKATEATRTGGYAIVDKTFQNGTESNTYRHVYFFPDVVVGKGDLVSLRTGEGPSGDYYVLTETDNGTPLHRFYWGSDAPIWNDADREAAFLIRYEVVDNK